MLRFGLVLVFLGLAMVIGVVSIIFAQGAGVSHTPALLVAAGGLLLVSGMACLERSGRTTTLQPFSG